MTIQVNCCHLCVLFPELGILDPSPKGAMARNKLEITIIWVVPKLQMVWDEKTQQDAYIYIFKKTEGKNAGIL